MPSAEDAALHLAQFSLDRAAIGILRIAIDGALLSANEFLCHKLGYSRSELCAMTIFDINPNLTADAWAEHIKAFVGVPTPRIFETTHRRKSGVTFPVEVTVSYLEYDGRQFFMACSRDLTDQKLAEAQREELLAQLSQAQKLESIGRLAGTVAHDFNNMLTVILGHAEALVDELEPGDLRTAIEEIQLAGQRSAELTRQLLGFARKQTVVPQVLDLNAVVRDMMKMLRRLIGEDISVTLTPAEGLWPVKMDPSQIDQVLVNLMVNARDAIAGTGEVFLETQNVVIDSAPKRQHVLPGRYVRLSVRDTGHGMDRDTREHLFEPFFTTKAPGRGTGLGLATVFGIVTQNGGTIEVDSEPGQGATFSLLLPTTDGDVETPAPSSDPHSIQGGSETLLLVEDEPLVLRLTQGLLETLGYRVLAAGTPAAALELVATHRDEIALLLTDLVMPQMNGRALAARVKQACPQVGVVLMSGYASGLADRLDDGTQFVRKPLVRAELATKLRTALEAAQRMTPQ